MSEKIISELKQVIGIVEQFDKDSAQDEIGRAHV